MTSKLDNKRLSKVLQAKHNCTRTRLTCVANHGDMKVPTKASIPYTLRPRQAAPATCTTHTRQTSHSAATSPAPTVLPELKNKRQSLSLEVLMAAMPRCSVVLRKLRPSDLRKWSHADEALSVLIPHDIEENDDEVEVHTSHNPSLHAEIEVDELPAAADDYDEDDEFLEIEEDELPAAAVDYDEDDDYDQDDEEEEEVEGRLTYLHYFMIGNTSTPLFIWRMVNGPEPHVPELAPRSYGPNEIMRIAHPDTLYNNPLFDVPEVTKFRRSVLPLSKMDSTNFSDWQSALLR